jgi:hypothetical protein
MAGVEEVLEPATCALLNNLVASLKITPKSDKTARFFEKLPSDIRVRI